MYTFVLLYGLFIGYTRVFTGLHTMEQILIGYGFGVIVHLLMMHIFRDQIENCFIGINKKTTRMFSNPVFFLYLGLLIINIALYIRIDLYFETPKLWTDTIAVS
jgi:multisubunit Na+/H+ antiporter MnhE subunit